MFIKRKSLAIAVAATLGTVGLGSAVMSQDTVKWRNPHFWDNPDHWNAKELYDPARHKDYMAIVEDALGRFNDVEVWKPRSSDTEDWQLVNGTYIPVTVDNKTPEQYVDQMRSDRPMMLPTSVQGYEGGGGQSNPYSVVGRMPGSNPEVQWVFLVRKYHTKELNADDFTMAGDVAVIGHHPRTGASTYFQFYHPQEPKEARVVISPFSGEEGMYFWSPLVTNAEYFQCQRCHSADPFIHTPWISQAKVSEPTDDNPFPENMVPANPLGAFFFLDTKDGLFEPWDSFLEHMDNPDNTCTECHRITPYDGAGLYENSTKFVGIPNPKDRNEYGWEMNKTYQTKMYQDWPWMPPVDLDDFYAGQNLVETIWAEKYAKDSEFINKMSQVGEAKVADINATPKFTNAQQATLRPVPAPPEQYRSIMVDRPFTDEFVASSGGVMIVDTRMRANTDADLAAWRFVQSNADANARAVPVILEQSDGTGATIQYDVIYMGAPRGADDAGQWVGIGDGNFALKQGQYLGLYMFAADSSEGDTTGMVPYTEDNYLKVTSSDGTTAYPDGVVAHRSFLKDRPAVGDTITFSDTNYVTYSFEMRNNI